MLYSETTNTDWSFNMILNRMSNKGYQEIHQELSDILRAVKITAEGVTEQNNNLFMQGYKVGYNDAHESIVEIKDILLKLKTIIINVETTLSCELIDDKLAERIDNILK